MKRSFWAVLSLFIVGIYGGCSNSNQSPDVTDNIQKSLDQAG
jgi:hypothetical protein